MRRRERRHPVLEEEESSSDEVAASSTDPELHLIRAEHRQQFRAAFRAALKELTADQRTLLRMHVVEGLTLDKIGKAYGVHRTTILRRLEAARARLLEAIRGELVSRLALRPSQINSWMRLAKTQLEVSLAPLLEQSFP